MMTTNNYSKMILAALTMSLTHLHAADPVVSNVTAAQRAGTKLVDITFDISDSDSDQLDISVNVSDDAGATFQVPGSALSGDTSVNAIATPMSHALVWDAGVDFNQQFSTDMVVRVIADDGSAAGPPPSGMKLIPAGVFQMGDASGSWGSNERPVHSVYISAFYMDEFEVTWKLWNQVRDWGLTNGYTDISVGEARGAHHPVHTINWYDAIKWCNARSEMEGLTPVYHTSATQTVIYRTGETTIDNDSVNWSASGYRLPTEAEWEKAARGSVEGREYPWGNTLSNGDANFLDSGDPFEFNDGTTETTPVGYYDGGQVPSGQDRANGYGLYDMAGNVSEWCWDAYFENWYSEPDAALSDTRGPDGTFWSRRVARGIGNWFGNSNNSNPVDTLRCAVRNDGYFPTLLSRSRGLRSARGL